MVHSRRLKTWVKAVSTHYYFTTMKFTTFSICFTATDSHNSQSCHISTTHGFVYTIIIYCNIVFICFRHQDHNKLQVYLSYLSRTNQPNLPTYLPVALSIYLHSHVHLMLCCQMLRYATVNCNGKINGMRFTIQCTEKNDYCVVKCKFFFAMYLYLNLLSIKEEESLHSK